ncbi:aspartyl protease family protein [Flavobacterium aciduliphilum]|uniref:aspartyl protease family protein n=1 Tax=Flavobacterium aciduliphilum TaxID=1101402 RepID=UPI0013140E18|nr:aspartyl protease family protein [Flavobacterium aciduliphilum]
MKKFVLLTLLLSQIVTSQNGFQFDTRKKSMSFRFEWVGNLIIIPVQMNGVSLHFLLDTGVSETILFSLDDEDNVSFNTLEKVSLRGFGTKEPFDAYQSKHNTLRIKNYVDTDHLIYLVLDQNISLSERIGVPVNGILGYSFFKNALVKINFSSKKITLYKDPKLIENMESRFEKIPMEIINNKPYISSPSFFENDTSVTGKFLVDTGNSDALWLFKNQNDSITLPSKKIYDYLGRGISGDVFGMRGTIPKFILGKTTLFNPLVSFPDSETMGSYFVLDRIGSIGTEILRRFTLYFSYETQALYVKKNSSFNDRYTYNCAGIEIQHQGLQWIKEGFEANPAVQKLLFDAEGNRIEKNLTYQFSLKPLYFISRVREHSKAQSIGLEANDQLVSINNRPAYSYTLQEINHLLQAGEGKKVTLEVNRKGKTLYFDLLLEDDLK